MPRRSAKRRRGASMLEALRYVLSEEARSTPRMVSWETEVDEASAEDGDETEPAERFDRAVLDVMIRLLQQPTRPVQVASALEVTQDQARVWLGMALDRDAVKRSSKPERFLARQMGLPGLDAASRTPAGSASSLAAQLRRTFLAAAWHLLQSPRRPSDVASELGVTEWQAKRWLDRLAAEGTVARVGGGRRRRRVR